MTSNPTTTHHHQITSPPGGLMIWIFIIMELLVFTVGFVSYFYSRSENPILFQDSQSQLNNVLATLNTMVLLISGYAVLLANIFYEKEEHRKSIKFFSVAILLGFLFIILKVYEYSEKINVGLITGVNTFYDFYWMLTVFHLFHVMAGIILLSIITWKIHRRRQFVPDFGVQTASSFWHMCDLIWVVLFPVIYLI